MLALKRKKYNSKNEQKYAWTPPGVFLVYYFFTLQAFPLLLPQFQRL